MAKLSTKKASTTHRCIIFGPPKAGKSLLAAKLAEHYKIIWIDMENGHETLFQLPQEWQERIELISLPDTRSYPIAIETVLKMVKGAVSICEQHGKVGCMVCNKSRSLATSEEEKAAFFVDVDLNSLDHDTVVVFDSSTQLTNSAISNITKGQPDDYKLQQDDWGNLGKLMDIFFSHVQQAPYNVVVISHETEAETEGKKKKLVPVAGTRNFSRNVAKYFDHVIYAEVKNKKHIFSSSTTSSNTILTGSRTGVDMEAGSGSLLEIFKPELYASSAGSKADVDSRAGVSNATASASASISTTTSAAGGSAKANAILDRLKAAKK